jgi:hypothetical protein
VTAWALMGAGELIGMRYLLWERDEQDNPPSAMPRGGHRPHDDSSATRSSRVALREVPMTEQDLAGHRALVTGERAASASRAPTSSLRAAHT